MDDKQLCASLMRRTRQFTPRAPRPSSSFRMIEFKGPVGPGTQNAVLYGDPTKPGVYVQRTKFPPGLKVMPHWHPDEWRTAVVLSGTLYFGVGEQWDESKLKAYPAGIFYSEPPKTAHYVWAKDGANVASTHTDLLCSGSTPRPPSWQTADRWTQHYSPKIVPVSACDEPRELRKTYPITPCA
jgi:quercetin dioxygenase-like cupin family protein